MKKVFSVVLIFLTGAGFAAAQSGYTPSTDILGAHLNFGRGCSACHAPHSGANGNGNGRGADPNSGNTALWGVDASALYGKTITTGGGKYVEVLPTNMTATTPDVNGMLTCLSCHDGNYASGAMMKNKVYERLPSTYGSSNTIPTLLGDNGSGTSGYITEHPMGLTAKVSCGGSGNWDCTQSNGVIAMKGQNSSRFVSNYGFFVNWAATITPPLWSARPVTTSM